MRRRQVTGRFQYSYEHRIRCDPLPQETGLFGPPSGVVPGCVGKERCSLRAVGSSGHHVGMGLGYGSFEISGDA